MKTLREYQDAYKLDFNVSECTSSIHYMSEQRLDYQVYLPSIQRHLQRDFVWDISQCRNLIESILLGRHVPHLALINLCVESVKDKEYYQVIDGKQRLNAMLNFYRNLFTIFIDDKEYYYKDLPQDYQNAIKHFRFRYYLVNEYSKNEISDSQKINWFKYLNFAGTPQDKSHIDSLILKTE